MNLNELKLLFVDDEKDIRDLMSDILSLEVEELFIAKDGLEALDKYKLYKPDIIISDINMPNMNGIDFIRKVRQNDHNTRVIMLTAHSEVDLLLEATELKLTKYILKPAAVDDLFDALDTALQELNNFNITSKQSFALDDNYVWDFNEKTLLNNSKEIHLTPKEKNILNLLFSNPNSTITYDRIIDEVWDDFDTYSIDTLKTMIKNIRKKLPKDTIKNVYGTGFKVEK